MVKAAAKEIKAAPSLAVKKAMKLADFSPDSCNKASLQMRVRRLVPTKKERLGKVPPPKAVSTGSPASDVSSITHSDTSSSGPTNPAPKPRRQRRTAENVAKDNVEAKRMKIYTSEAHKRCTSLYAEEKAKPNGMSADQVRACVLKEYEAKCVPSAKTIKRYVDDGKAGISPKKKGRPSTNIQESTFLILCNAYESFVRINQINGTTTPREILAAKIKAVIGKTEICSFKLLDRIIKETALDFLASKSESVEQRRILWTSYNNLKMWFNSWCEAIEVLGFAERDEKGELFIPLEQLARILNIDETCLSMDGSSGARGGRPQVFFYDPRLPQVGRGVNKSGTTNTFITGSTAVGEAIPPHFQFQTKAQPDNMRIRTDMLQYFPKVMGKFGCAERREWQPSIGMNLKGGMDDDEFFKYLKVNIIPLYPDALDVKGKRVMIKIDSGPGRLNMDMIVYCRSLGFYLFPSVPNATSVSQETDRNYGPFKTAFRKNLSIVVEARIAQNLSTSIPPYMIGLIVFGRNKDPLSGVYVESCAYEAGFSVEQCLKAWGAVGAAPPTRACLNDKKVRREVGDADDDMNKFMLEIQQMNDHAVNHLNSLGYKGELLEATIKKVKQSQPLTVPQSKERMLALAEANSHGARFLVTGGHSITGDDALLAAEVPRWKSEIKELEDDKLKRQKLAETEAKGKEVLASGKSPEQLKVAQLDAILDMHHIEKKNRGKMSDKLKSVKEVWGKTPPAFSRWTDEEESQLKEKREMKITMKDTAFARYQDAEKHRVRASLWNMSEEDRCEVLREIARIESSKKLDDDGGGKPKSVDEPTKSVEMKHKHVFRVAQSALYWMSGVYYGCIVGREKINARRGQ